MTAIRREQIRAETRLKLESVKEAAKAEREAAKQTANEQIAQVRRVNDEARKRGGGGGLIGYFGGRHIVNSVGRSMSGVARSGMGMLGSAANGLGIDFDLASITRRNVDLARMSQEIVNSGFQKGAAGPAGVRQNAGDIEAESRKTGIAWGIDPGQVAQAHKAFIGVTGDLAMSRELMGELAKLSTATGSNIEDVAKAAAKVSAQLPDTADKGKKVLDVMQAVASQGKLGGAEMATTAIHMSKLAAVANKFGGDSAANMKGMGVLYQEAIQHGGAGKEAQSATAIAGFVNAFSKKATIKGLNALNIHARDSGDFLKDPESIITQLLVKTGGHAANLTKVLPDVRAQMGMEGFRTAFLRASGGKTDSASLARGAEAVHAEFARLSAQLMDNTELEKEAGDRMKDADKRAQIFQNRLDEVGKGIQARLQPALEKLAPYVLQAADALGKMVEWASKNPATAITAAIVGSIAKAGIGEVVARAIGTSAAQSGAAGALGGFANTLGAATLMVAGLGLAADQAMKLWNELHPETTYAAGTTEEEKNRLSGMTREQKQAELARTQTKSNLEEAGYNVGNQAGPIDPRVQKAIEMAGDSKVQQDQLKALQGVLRVEIINVDEIRRRAGDLPSGGPEAPLLPTDGVTGLMSIQGGA